MEIKWGCCDHYDTACCFWNMCIMQELMWHCCMQYNEKKIFIIVHLCLCFSIFLHKQEYTLSVCGWKNGHNIAQRGLLNLWNINFTISVFPSDWRTEVVIQLLSIFMRAFMFALSCKQVRCQHMIVTVIVLWLTLSQRSRPANVQKALLLQLEG